MQVSVKLCLATTTSWLATACGPFKLHDFPCTRSPAKTLASLAGQAGQARLSGFLVRLTWKMRPGEARQERPQPSQFLATVATKAWPSWPCYSQGRAFSASPVKKARPSRPQRLKPGLAGLFEFPGQNFKTLSDCNIKPQNLWPFVVSWRTLFALQLLFFHKEGHIVSFHI